MCPTDNANVDDREVQMMRSNATIIFILTPVDWISSTQLRSNHAIVVQSEVSRLRRVSAQIK
jgi:hypothetical protein